MPTLPQDTDASVNPQWEVKLTETAGDPTKSPANITDDEFVSDVPRLDLEALLADSGLSNEQKRARRLARKPSVDHLPDAVGVLPDGTQVPLFDVGDRIVVERFMAWDHGDWLDTRVYLVREIDDDTGYVKCIDEEQNHHAVVGFKHDHQRFKLAPKRGNPFNVPKVVSAQASKPLVQELDQNGNPVRRGRGRPKGSKNRPKELIKAEKEAKKAEKKARRAHRKVRVTR